MAGDRREDEMFRKLQSGQANLATILWKRFATACMVWLVRPNQQLALSLPGVRGEIASRTSRKCVAVPALVD
jgi:hypothetical protein